MTTRGFSPKVLIRLGLSCLIAAGVAALAVHALQGPQLGPRYDRLLRFAGGAPVSGEILLIETRLPQVQEEGEADFVEGASVIAALLIMAEMNAGALVIQAPVSQAPFPALPSGVSRDELRLRFDSEFNLIERNILNLFEAIRLGFIPPSEAERYVGELASVTLRGKDRLFRAVYPADRDEQSPLERAMAVFGRAWTPGPDRRFRVRPDRDGKIRRVFPEQGSAEHIVYAALKDRLRREGLLPGEGSPSPDPGGKGAVFLVKPEGDFRRLPLAVFVEHEEADKELYRLLANAESQGLYAALNPEAYPGYRYDYARNLLEELLRDPSPERRTRWLIARKNYYQSLEDFFAGPAETNLVEEHEKLTASDSPDPETLRRFAALRNELILSFRNLREKYAGLLALRSVLERELPNSFCIMGAPGPELESSAVLANTLLAGASVRIGSDRDVLLITGAGVLAILGGLCFLGPWVSLGLGLLLAALLGLGFSLNFILRGLWMDPLIPVSSALAGVLVSCAFAFLARLRAAARFRAACGPRMAPGYLRLLIRAGQPFPRETVTVSAALVAVRDGNLNGIESRSGPEESARAVAAFRKEALRRFSGSGAVMTGVDGDLAIFALGSPLERQALTKMKGGLPYDDDTMFRSPGARAAALVLDMLQSAPDSWRFAVAAGRCGFSWSPESGYTAQGRAAISVRRLSGLCSRHKTRLIVSGSVAESLGDIPVKKLGVLVDQGGGEGEQFYGLLGGEIEKTPSPPGGSRFPPFPQVTAPPA